MRLRGSPDASQCELQCPVSSLWDDPFEEPLTSEANIHIPIISSTLIFGQVEDVKGGYIAPEISHIARDIDRSIRQQEGREASFTIPSWLPIDLPQF